MQCWNPQRIVFLLWYLKISVVCYVWFCKWYTLFRAAFISNFLLLMAVELDHNGIFRLMYIHGEVVITKQTIINYDPPKKTILVYTPDFIFHSPCYFLQKIILTESIESKVSRPHEVLGARGLLSTWSVLTQARTKSRRWTCVLCQWSHTHKRTHHCLVPIHTVETLQVACTIFR